MLLREVQLPVHLELEWGAEQALLCVSFDAVKKARQSFERRLIYYAPSSIGSFSHNLTQK
jgi:hypothetical protein